MTSPFGFLASDLFCPEIWKIWSKKVVGNRERTNNYIFLIFKSVSENENLQPIEQEDQTEIVRNQTQTKILEPSKNSFSVEKLKCQPCSSKNQEMGGKHPLLSMELAKIEDPNEGLLEDLRVKTIPADLNLDVMIPDVPNLTNNLMERRDKNVSFFHK